MSRRRRKGTGMPVHLNTGDLEELPMGDIRLVLRGASPLIGCGGRTTLVRLLRGSKAKKVLPFSNNPTYGVYADLSEQQVLNRVDWCIKHRYLTIDKVDGFSLLNYTQSGLMIECFTIAGEALVQVEAESIDFFKELVDYPHATLFALFDLIAEAGPDRFRKPLQTWQSVATKRMKSQINRIFSEWDTNATPQRHAFEVCYLDEDITEFQWNTSIDLQKNLSLFHGEYRWVINEFPGVQDIDLLKFFSCQKRTALITCDRAFHNAMLKNGLASFHYDRERSTLSREPVKGVKPRGILSVPQPKTQQQQNIVETPIAKTLIAPSFLAPETPREQKKWRTKRRRIRNYFGGVERMNTCRITLALRPQGGNKWLVGVQSKITSKAELKAINATETYLELNQDQPQLGYLVPLILHLRLAIAEIPFQIFYHNNHLPNPPQNCLADDALAIYEDMLQIIGGNVEWIAVTKPNVHMDKLQKKLATLAKGKSNEVVLFDYNHLQDRWQDWKQSHD